MTSATRDMSAESTRWLADAVASIDANRDTVFALSARAVRECGAQDADLVRCALIEHVPSSATRLFREGDVLERIAVLASLHRIDVDAPPIIEEALRCNDTRVVEAALGPRSAELADHVWRRAVLKFAYLGLPLSSVDGLADRIDDILRTMLRELVRERASAGRTVPSEIHRYL